MKQGKGKKIEESACSDDETPSPEQNPKYQEFNDSISTTDTDDGRCRRSIPY
jgi:hypothetical protein